MDKVLTCGLPPEKWSSLKYGLWPGGGLKNAEDRDTRRKRLSRSCEKLSSPPGSGIDHDAASDILLVRGIARVS
jgi:hypothetical protein